MNTLTQYIFNNLRILKGRNIGDTYYEEYQKHYAREGNDFYDHYHLAVEAVAIDKPRRILEIGVRTGICICNMLSAYVDQGFVTRVVLIDLWNDGFTSENIVKMNLKCLNIPTDKIEFIKGDSLVEVPKLQGEFDWILVDGCHDKPVAKQDLENVVRLCAKGGTIVFDDISQYGCGLDDVWQEFKQNHLNEFMFDENYKGKGVGWAVKL